MGSKPTFRVTSEVLKEVEELSSQSMENWQIWESLGIKRSLFYELKKDNVEFADALERGRRKTIQRVVDAVVKRAEGFEHTEVHKRVRFRDETGKLLDEPRMVVEKEVVKYFPPNVEAQRFYLANKDPDNWKEKLELGGSIDHVIIKIPKGLEKKEGSGLSENGNGNDSP